MLQTYERIIVIDGITRVVLIIRDEQKRREQRSE